MLPLAFAFVQEETGSAAGAASLIPWLLAACWIALLACAIAAWVLLSRLRELEQRLEPLAQLTELRERLAQLMAERAELDLRRVEHVLVDIRDGNRRVEDALLRTIESGARQAAGASPGSPAGQTTKDWGERVHNRLLALGYERVELVTAPAELERIGEGDGEIAIEARRNGVLYKGRVVVRDGRIATVEVQPPFALFP